MIVIFVGGISKPEFLIADRHAVAALAHRRIRKSHRAELFFIQFDLREVDLNINQVSVDSINSSTAGLEKHDEPDVSLRRWNVRRV